MVTDESTVLGWEQQLSLVPTQAHGQRDSFAQQNWHKFQCSSNDPVSDFLLNQNLDFRAQRCFPEALNVLVTQVHELPVSASHKNIRRLCETSTGNQALAQNTNAFFSKIF
jgi:hypothetical protein